MAGHELLVGRYEVRGVLGHGGMAQVRDGWDTRLDRPVAVKLLHPGLLAGADVRRRFEDEARAAAALSHPNLVAVYDYGEHRGVPFIVMERLPGQTLADLIAQRPMPPDHVRAMLDDVLAALQVAHRAGILHRDIKPGNVLLSATGDAMKLGDFGIAKADGTAQTVTGQVVGTMGYLSPQRVAGAPAAVTDDIYALGVVAYEALTARRAFGQDNPVALARAIMDDPPPPVTAARADVDPVLGDVIARAMARDPAQRFATADQMRAALAGDRGALLAGATVGVVPPRPATRVLDQPLPPTVHPVGPPPARRSRVPERLRKPLIAAAVLLAFIVSVLALATDPSSSTAPPEPVTSTTAAPTPSSAPPSPPALPAAQQPEQQPADKKPEPKHGGDKPGGHGNNGKGHGADKHG